MLTLALLLRSERDKIAGLVLAHRLMCTRLLDSVVVVICILAVAPLRRLLRLLHQLDQLQVQFILELARLCIAVFEMVVRR